MVLLATAVAPFAAVMTAFRMEPAAHLLGRQATTAGASILSVCSDQVVNCIPTVRSCATSLCARCTSIGVTAIDFCCDESNQASCFSSVLADALSTTTDDTFTATSDDSSLTGGGSAGTAIPAACSSLESVVTSCSRATPGFDQSGSTEAASCLCYNTRTSYVGTQVDGYIETCVSYLSTAAPDLYTTIRELENFCEDVGDVRGDGDVVTTSTRPATTRFSASAGSSAVATGPISTAASAAFRVDALISSNPVAGLILAAALFLTLT